MKTKILLVDDEEDILEFLQYNLEEEGFEVVIAENGKIALEKLSFNPDLIVLDVMMPNMDGYETCKRIREIEDFKTTPIIFLTAKSNENDEILGLNIGANDFISKPVSTKKFIARINANLRGNKIEKKTENEIINIGHIKINIENHTVSVGENQIFFPKKEFLILKLLASKPGRVFSRAQLLDSVWGPDVYVVERTVDVHVRKIREKLGEYANMIETIKGIGYKLKNE